MPKPELISSPLTLPDPQATENFGIRLAACVRAGDVIALDGPIGAGKTSLARGLLRGLGHAGEVPSPTFTLVQTYDPPDIRLPVWHVDLYRLEDPGEIDELGLDESEGAGLLLVEWPERWARSWESALFLSLRPDDRGGRDLTARVPAAWEARWPPP